MVDVEVIYISADNQIEHVSLSVQENTSVGDVLQRSGIYKRLPETEHYEIGIFSKKVTLDHPVQAGDRIEIYRPLTIDPKEKRRLKARKT